MTTPPSSLPPANWYPDPQTPGQLRYWDGQRWTQHVHPAQQPAQGVGGAGGVPVQAGPGVFLPSGRPGSAQPGQGASPAQGTFTPTQAGPAQGIFAPIQASPAQGAYAPIQASPAQGAYAPTDGSPAQGFFAPTQAAPTQAAPAQAAPAQGAYAPTDGSPAQGFFAPTQAAPTQAAPAQAGPAQGAYAPTQASPVAPGPASGPLQTFQPSGVAGTSPFPAALRSPVNLDVDDIPRGRSKPDPYDSLESTGASTQAKLATVFGFLAVLFTAISIYGLHTGFDTLITLAAGVIGFVSVFLGFAGVGKGLQGHGGRGRSFFAIAMGFLAIGLNTYEFLNPQALYKLFAGFFPH